MSEEVSVAPSPSVSSTKIGWGPVRSMAKMMPLVQELTADDVSKARVRRSRFSRKLSFSGSVQSSHRHARDRLVAQGFKEGDGVRGDRVGSVPTLDERDHRRKCGWIFGPAKQLRALFLVEKSWAVRRPPSARTFAWKRLSALCGLSLGITVGPRKQGQGLGDQRKNEAPKKYRKN